MHAQPHTFSYQTHNGRNTLGARVVEWRSFERFLEVYINPDGLISFTCIRSECLLRTNQGAVSSQALTATQAQYASPSTPQRRPRLAPAAGAQRG
eukprot:scaffold1928_cov381-Prasinococcus_capsulatus_cf.AAC.27